MAKIKLLLTGATSQDFIMQGMKEYTQRMSRYVNFEINEVVLPKKFRRLSESALKDSEARAVLKYIDDKDTVILLDEKGKQYRSVEFAEYIKKCMVQSIKSIAFIIGGAYGFSEALYDRANGIISFSDMTFSHQIIRVMFMEQLYRAFTIIHNEPYHHE
jgi:23S rRNA (pseudouridine1915-N3)-methyltransferase